MADRFDMDMLIRIALVHQTPTTAPRHDLDSPTV